MIHRYKLTSAIKRAKRIEAARTTAKPSPSAVRRARYLRPEGFESFGAPVSAEPVNGTDEQRRTR